MNYKGIIFDLDGVICFTDKYHYMAWKQIANEEGIFFNETINNRLRGVSRMESLQIILEGSNRNLTGEEKNLMADRKNKLYVKLLQEISPNDLSEDVRKSLKELREKGYLLAIGSSSKNAKFILGRLGLGQYFDAVSDGTNITKSKPNPEVFLKAANMLNLKPQECLVVEDAVAGIEAAINGGFDSAGIGEAAAYSKTKYPLNSFDNLIDIL